MLMLLVIWSVSLSPVHCSLRQFLQQPPLTISTSLLLTTLVNPMKRTAFTIPCAESPIPYERSSSSGLFEFLLL
ncbi:hypothetical protein GBAR_LOCUS27407 [Geodia barretti]|uniref:Secreted protein n=1 Tax=Geodia barretti TaxID=519541 RepID=A0AA35TK48_GEOBA|nr:hypothetical protein GBAR_LOCUS27407 [Geodia barretti]